MYLPFFFCTSRHRHEVSQTKVDQQLAQIQSSLDHCAYSLPLQANISWRSFDQSPRSACMSGRSTKLEDRLCGTRNSQSTCPFRWSQPDIDITNGFPYATQLRTCFVVQIREPSCLTCKSSNDCIIITMTACSDELE